MISSRLGIFEEGLAVDTLCIDDFEQTRRSMAKTELGDVERFFGLLTERQVRRGVHRSTAELEAAIHAYIEAHNAKPKPFRWVKSADDILAAVDRFCRRTLETNTTLRRT